MERGIIMERISRTPEETRAMARALGREAAAGHTFALIGPLGAGKTCFAQGLLEGLGVSEPVTSPTFTLINEYEGRVPVVHCDAYRLPDGAELGGLGLDDCVARGAVVVVEWADRAGDVLPDERLEIHLAYEASLGETVRRIRFEARGREHADLLRRALGTG